MRSIFSKSLLVLLITSLLLPASFFGTKSFAPRKAEAVTVFVAGGRLDVVEFIPQLVGIQASVAAETSQTFSEWIRHLLRETIRKRLLDTMVDQIIGWINGEGDPKFVTDWSGYIEDAAGVALGDFAKELGLGFLCSPFSAQIQIALAPERRFQNEISCTLDDITSNIENFYNDFTDGGWIAYNGSWEPQNNLYGAWLIATDEQARREANAIYAADREATTGDGFLAVKNCEEAPAGTPAAAGPDLDKDGKKGDVPPCKITLPGQAVGQLATQAINIDIPYLLSAQEFDAYLGAIVNALFNRLVRVGVDGLQGLSSNSDQGSDFVNNPTNPCTALVGAARTTCEEYVANGRGDFTSARSHLSLTIDSALAARREAQGILDGSITKLQQYQAFLIRANASRDVCVSETDLSDASTLLASMQSRRDVNQILITNLEQAKGQLAGLTTDDWDGFGRINTSVSNSAAVQLAESFKNDVTTERQDLFAEAGFFDNETVPGRLTVRSQQVSSCSGLLP